MPTTNDAQRQPKLVTLQQYQTVMMQLGANNPVGRVAIRISSSINQWRNTKTQIFKFAPADARYPKASGLCNGCGDAGKLNATAITYRPGKS